ncbi:MAG: hypothetical protein QOE27_1131 [Solirubrobacteraceae bacterium]|nr:hypothetical protein [Solirubrobacteraceae bacterium]MEA2302573.1 hypothetical protein [Solirubrobacteraceae bacterium]
MSKLDAMIAARKRAELVTRMRGLAKPPPAPDVERCELCETTVPSDHRHLLHLVERRIVCSCEVCWAKHSGDPEYRPAGMRTVWLEDFECSDDMWANFAIPIGLAFFMRSGLEDRVVGMYPSPAGATECELDLEAWDRLVAANPVLEHLDIDGEALLVNRMGDEHQYAIAPIDACYRLVGLIKSNWEGISGGTAIEKTVPTFFEELRAKDGAYQGG